MLTAQREEKSHQVSPLREKIRKLAMIVPKLDQRLTTIKEEENRIEERVAKFQKHLALLKQVSREKIERIKEKEMLHLELKQLRAVVTQKVKDITSAKKPALNRTEVKELKLLLKKIDNLLGRLPKKEIEKFSRSKDFEFYKKVMHDYGVK
jgi:chromosome segregation ATPase